MEFPTGTTAVLVNGKHVLLADYLASQGEAAKPDPPEVGDAPLTLAQTAASEPLASDVAEKAGVAHLVEALEIAGFVTAVSIDNASIDQLTTVPGIGKATAVKLRTAAEELLS